MAAVITAIYDRYDTLKPVCPQSLYGVDWVCVTDDADLTDGVGGWRILYEPQPNLHPNRAAKRPKLLPWAYTRAPRSVWVDASFRITSPEFVGEAIAFANPIAQFAHPWRDCVYEEATASVGLPKYAGEDLMAHAGHVLATGHPAHWGLWATGVIARQHTDAVRQLGALWMDEIRHHTYQDQLSQPGALRECGLRPVTLPGTHMANPWLRYEGSSRH